MRKTVLALSFLILALLVALIVSTGLGLAQEGGPVQGARPTPTVEGGPVAPSAASPDTPSLPDLIVESIEVLPSSPRIGDEATILVTIKNQGPVDVKPDNNFFTDLYVDPAVVPIQLGQDGVKAWGCQAQWVPSGGSHTLATTYVFTDVRSFALWAQVDTDGTVAESNETNNVTGPVIVKVRSPNTVMHQTHQDFQMGMASSLDVSHPQGVMRPGIFIEPHDVPDVYEPDSMVNHFTGTLPLRVSQINPALTSNGQGVLYAAWQDNRNGYGRTDIYFSRYNPATQQWGPDVRINDNPIDDPTEQVSPDLAYDTALGRLYAVWQDGRLGDFDIRFSFSDDGGDTWSASEKLNDDVDPAHQLNQLNPSIVVGPSPFNPAQNNIYVAWQDQRNGNADVYLARSGDGGLNWQESFFVPDDPQAAAQNQVAPSVDVDGLGALFVSFEDWRAPEHPEVYVTWSWDEGESFGIDVPVDVPGEGTSYRIEPTLVVSTTREEEEYFDPGTGLTETIIVDISAVHVAFQQGKGDEADVYWAYAIIDYYEPDPCPWPYDFCFEPPGGGVPEKVNGFVIDSDYVLPADDPGPIWPIEPSWQGQATASPAGDFDWTYCHAASPITYSKGIFLAWSDARSYDDWRYEIHTRRVASPEGDPKVFELCEDQTTGMVNGNPKLYAYRDGVGADGDPLYDYFKPAATGQAHPYVHSELADSVSWWPDLWVVWDDDRWDKPLEASTVRNRDVFFAEHGPNDQGVYVSPVVDSFTADPKWYVLSWYGATDHYGDLLLQTRFGVEGATLPPPLDNVADGGWTKWTGNPSSTYLGCTLGEDCYYDAPGRHIVRPDGSTWFTDPDGDQYRYIQYKVVMRGSSRRTALSRVLIYYDGGETVYLPLVVRNR